MPLLILDRDGVINEDSDNYIRKLEDWRPIAGSIEAIAELSRAGFRIAIATNQSGLGRGYFDLDDLESIHSKLCSLVEEHGGKIDGIFYCPHLPDAGCDCRKPRTGLLASIERELGLPAKGAIFIGDSLKDLQAARAFGCKPMLVQSGKGEQTLSVLQSDTPGVERPSEIPVYVNLAAASLAILTKNLN
ncbi:MAG: D-glycero-beta-D-manno-heptose 1,7-bisphosphate 7-phosphatase [Halioglobus sp.]